MFVFQIGFLDVNWLDLVDILLVAVLLYQIYNLVRGSVASRVFVGYLLIYLVYLVVKALRLNLLTTILEYFISVGALALIIIFQPEIRRFLQLIGRTTNLASYPIIRRLLLRQQNQVDPTLPLRPVLDATKTLSAEFAGSLIVVQRNDDLDKFVQSGDLIDAVLSKQLLVALFNQYSPLNDGAVIVSKGRIRSARCVLPISDDDSFEDTLGFRHRAALGMSEATDAAVIVISEETGRISMAINGKLIRNLLMNELEEELLTYMTEPAKSVKA